MLNKYISIFIIALCCVACEPQVDVKPDIGEAPNPSFEITQGSTPNTFILTNTTPDVFLTSWDLGSAGQLEGATAEAIFPFMGNYEITMTTFNRGGSASLTQSVIVTEDDPNACVGNFETLTSCTEKIWKLAPQAGALHVGPNATEVWWENSEEDVDARPCHFNDEYIFREDGSFEYDNKGDFWADSDGDGNIFPGDMGISVGCHPSSEWPAAYQAWDSGVHSFSATANTLTVSGEGAWIGLYKVGTTSEVAVPQESVTYSIQSLTDTEMVLVSDLGGVVWKFTLTSQ